MSLDKADFTEFFPMDNYTMRSSLWKNAQIDNSFKKWKAKYDVLVEIVATY